MPKCEIVHSEQDIWTECPNTAIGYIRSGDAVCPSHAYFGIQTLVEPFPLEYINIVMVRKYLSFSAQEQLMSLCSKFTASPPVEPPKSRG